MKLKKKAKKILLLLLIILIVGLLGVVYYFGFMKKTTPGKKVAIVNEIKKYGYKLKDNETAQYKKLFTQLEKELKKEKPDEEKYVTLISKMFIIDFYTLDDKLAKTDVGGIDFVGSTVLSNFLVNAEDTYYKYVENDIYGSRKQSLPSVDEVTIESVENNSFTYGEVTDDNAYVVKAKWTYKTTVAGYQDSATLIFVHDNDKLVLVELK